MGKKKVTTNKRPIDEVVKIKEGDTTTILGSSLTGPPGPPVIVKERPWKALIMYPTLAIAMIGAVPQYYTMVLSSIKGVSSDRMRQQEHISNLWKSNLDCIKKDAVPVSDHKTEIQVRFCSASLFLVEKYRDDKSFYEWVEINDGTTTSFLDVSIYADQEHGIHKHETLCTSNKDKRVYQIIKDLTTGKCKLTNVDQTTGVATRKEVDCNTHCPE